MLPRLRSSARSSGLPRPPATFLSRPRPSEAAPICVYPCPSVVASIPPCPSPHQRASPSSPAINLSPIHPPSLHLFAVHRFSPCWCSGNLVRIPPQRWPINAIFTHFVTALINRPVTPLDQISSQNACFCVFLTIFRPIFSIIKPIFTHVTVATVATAFRNKTPL
jgi:hypothetical protein